VETDRVDIPKSFWERLISDKRRLALVGGGALLVLLALAWAVLAGPLAGGGGEWGQARPVALDPIEESTEISRSAEPTATETSSRTADADTDTEGDSGTRESEPDGPEFVRAPIVAYRLEDALWTANEDGSGSRLIASSPTGAYALSPDGTTLAWVDSGAHTFHLTEVRSGKDMVIGPAEDVRPCWAPDSSYVAYTGVASAHLQVRAVMSDGRGDHLLGDGHSPSVSQDGRIAFISSGAPGAMGPIVVTDTRQKSVELPTRANAVAFGGDGLVWVSIGAGVGSERIMTSRTDGSSARELIGSSSLDRPVTYAMLCVSPSGDHILYGTSGDDGFSRAFVSALTKPSPVSLTVRRDTYPHGWSADGSRVFFFEGNTFQGETSALVRCDTSGFGRVTVVRGAEL